MKKPVFNDLAKSRMSKEAKKIIATAMQKACDEQVRTLEEAARRTCDFEATAAGGEE